ncbi:hypothetical protein YWIDRAFT_02293 [Streptomyces sp. SceaMP-e96]|nr:hypothetical protein YWIDRAFT_02293 [Streptomyces sp. SceaMP-e96]
MPRRVEKGEITGRRVREEIDTVQPEVLAERFDIGDLPVAAVGGRIGGRVGPVEESDRAVREASG